jgi:hypothetical protein
VRWWRCGLLDVKILDLPFVFSARWTTVLTPDATVDGLIGIDADDPVRLCIAAVEPLRCCYWSLRREC